jgi:hypothetical protein
MNNKEQLETPLPFQLVDSVTGKKLTSDAASLQVNSSCFSTKKSILFILKNTLLGAWISAGQRS